MSRLVHVEWEDAFSVDAWTAIAELDCKPKACSTVGYLVRESADTVAIAGTTSSADADGCCFMVIPRKMIVRISEITNGEEIVLHVGLKDDE